MSIPSLVSTGVFGEARCCLGCDNFPSYKLYVFSIYSLKSAAAIVFDILFKKKTGWHFGTTRSILNLNELIVVAVVAAAVF